ncbi:uncharacterized protein KY384_001405 [Bacidia gigantensis]|uniref:uncharacterized protein n=1 Tax=Bacidia gigantensis TaxID=2732470 RepID=UPI001D053B83|nr:uncharacterized protein KY384_001405 [Bacidia gigantensis]KAG8533664.1 hypothetical protein KY384_001405 [Bacidia gigantensis]
MAASDGASSISVAIRVRPFTVREAAQLAQVPDGPLFLGDGSLTAQTPSLKTKGIRPILKVVDDKCLVFDPPDEHAVQKSARFTSNGKRAKDQTFGFDRVFDENATQADVYEATTRNLLDSVLDGYNATVFAYGATGCGKTHTITGTVQAPGVIFLTMQELFERIGERSDEKVTEISLSYLEIYNETIRDLLVPGGSKQGLMLREDAHQAVSVAGLSSHRPQNVQEVMDIIVRGNEYRTMSPTDANATSSRSHAVLQINIAQKDRNADINEPHTMATLSIIDLAGSERASATKNRGERLQEGANINKSLLALGSCINALCDPRKRNHIPYRNSKLTRLLKFSLGGNCKTVMIVCISPSSVHFDETQNTLRYANRAKNIQTKVTRNVYNVNRHVKDFVIKIDEQMALINELKEQLRDHEGVSFSKFSRSQEKREVVTREAVARIRKAYDDSEKERSEKTTQMKKLRQIEKRIVIISGWVAAFDQINDSLEETDALQNCSAMRKTAQGILLELENSRHHYHQRIAKNNWERSMDSALQNGIRQLKEVDAKIDAIDASCLGQQFELLKGQAEREALLAVAEDEKTSEAGLVQVLLQAHFETMAAIQDLLAMSEDEAVEAAKGILGKLLKSCTSVISHVIKPDGSLMPNEAFPPSQKGTPKRKKQYAIGAPSPMKAMLPPAVTKIASFESPSKASPRRRKAMAARKGISFTPKKKSPVKNSKRGVRWRDDTDEGTLAEFEKTPQKLDSTPDTSSVEPAGSEPSLASMPNDSNSSATMSDDDSPVPAPPVVTSEPKSKNNRFKTGFLAKRTDGSPLPPTLTQLSSDSDTSPLRELTPLTAGNHSSLQHVQNAADISASANVDNSGSESEDRWRANKSDAMQIKSAMKRASMAASGSVGANRQRRRSPTGSASGSPPPDTLFTASHARRMVKSDKENDWKTNILSPHTAPVVKYSGSRRTTMAGEGRMRDSAGPAKDAVRLSGAMLPPSRGSLVTTGKDSAIIHIHQGTALLTTFSLLTLLLATSIMTSTMPSFLSRLLRPFTTSSSMSLQPPSQAAAPKDFPPNAQKCTVAAGCFWGVEHLFRKHFDNKGLLDAKVGYIGGDSNSPSYRAVCSGRTGHAEALQMVFDPEVVSYATLLQFFYKMHDPTTKNRQGMDSGTQYRSAVFWHGEAQKKEAEEVQRKVDEQWWKGKVTTEILEAGQWWDAEDYHQLYLHNNPGGYECPAHYVRSFPDLK